MNRQLLASLIVLIAVASVTALWPKPEAEADANGIPAVPVQRCMNLSGAMEAPYEGLWGYTIREVDLKRIKSAGFDTVRFPVKWRLIDSRNGPRIDPKQLARVDEVIFQALNLDLKIILNVHHYRDLFRDPDKHEPNIAAIWQQLSARYANFSHDLIFELVNEPTQKMTIERTDKLNRRLLSIVRETNPNRWVLFGTAQWGSLHGMLKSDPPYDPKAIIGFHYYEPFDFTHQGASFSDNPPPTGTSWGTSSDRASMREDFLAATKFRESHGMPLILGEFGVYEDVPLNLRAEWTHAVRTEAELAGFGWCYWGFGTTFKSFDQNKQAWIRPILRALIR